MGIGLTPDWRGELLATRCRKAMEAKAGSRNEVSSDPAKRGMPRSLAGSFEPDTVIG